MTKLPQMPQDYDLVAVDTIGSTNEELKRRAIKEDAAEGLTLWSLEQTSGKGRQLREWVSKPGNMYCSVLFRPDCAMADAAQIGFLPVIAAGEALAEILGVAAPLRYKWPNDLLLNRKKIGGTLLEAGVAQNGLAAWVVAGCGINLRHFPADTRFPAASVKDELALDIEVSDMVEAYVAKLAVWYSRWQEEGFEPVREAWLASAHTFDEPLIVESGSEKLSGPFRDLDEHGALVIETADGSRRITAGDVYFSNTEGGES